MKYGHLLLEFFELWIESFIIWVCFISTLNASCCMCNQFKKNHRCSMTLLISPTGKPNVIKNWVQNSFKIIICNMLAICLFIILLKSVTWISLSTMYLTQLLIWHGEHSFFFVFFISFYLSKKFQILFRSFSTTWMSRDIWCDIYFLYIIKRPKFEGVHEMKKKILIGNCWKNLVLKI